MATVGTGVGQNLAATQPEENRNHREAHVGHNREWASCNQGNWTFTAKSAENSKKKRRKTGKPVEPLRGQACFAVGFLGERSL